MSQDKDASHQCRTISLVQKDALDHYNRIDEVCSKFKHIVIFTFDLSQHSQDSRVLMEHMQLEHALHLSQTFI